LSIRRKTCWVSSTDEIMRALMAAAASTAEPKLGSKAPVAARAASGAANRASVSRRVMPGTVAQASGLCWTGRRPVLLRKPRRVQPRNDPQRVLVVDLLQYLVRQPQPVHLPERVPLAVVVEVLVPRLEYPKVVRIFIHRVDVFPEQHAVLVLHQEVVG